MGERQQREPRDVRSADPSLSPEANRILTDELREVIGSDTAEVPVGRARVAGASHGGRSRLFIGVSDNRVLFGSLFFVALVIGAVLAITTGSWWLLPLAVGLDLLGTVVVATLVLGLTTEVEHVDPSSAVRLQEEGVEDPDRLFSELVEEFAPEDEQARDEAEQRRRVTPSRRSRPVGP
ncbi:MAG TPA: hypothetical protein VLK58_24980 [Conexibacter sp.]|nr:hypothetical protein [Conexibacter sp.]